MNNNVSNIPEKRNYTTINTVEEENYKPIKTELNSFRSNRKRILPEIERKAGRVQLNTYTQNDTYSTFNSNEEYFSTQQKRFKKLDNIERENLQLKRNLLENSLKENPDDLKTRYAILKLKNAEMESCYQYVKDQYNDEKDYSERLYAECSYAQYKLNETQTELEKVREDNLTLKERNNVNTYLKENAYEANEFLNKEIGILKEKIELFNTQNNEIKEMKQKVSSLNEIIESKDAKIISLELQINELKSLFNKIKNNVELFESTFSSSNK